MLSSNDFKTVSSPLILSRTHKWHPVRTGDGVSILILWDERMDNVFVGGWNSGGIIERMGLFRLLSLMKGFRRIGIVMSRAIKRRVSEGCIDGRICDREE